MLQYGDDDDLFDDSDNESELSSDGPKPRVDSQQPRGKRRLRIRPMSPSMVDKHPEVVTILLTRSNGQQLMFVRK